MKSEWNVVVIQNNAVSHCNVITLSALLKATMEDRVNGVSILKHVSGCSQITLVVQNHYEVAHSSIISSAVYFYTNNESDNMPQHS
jgi:hypothetical protein